jgi:hypothetical protein
MISQQKNLPLLSFSTSKSGKTSLHSFSESHSDQSKPIVPETFSISLLPPELRNEIYAHHFASLSPLKSSFDNVASALHQETQLSLSSPYLKYDILPSTFYLNNVFSFSNPKVLKQFARRKWRDQVERVRIEYGKLSRCHSTDWIFLLFQHFKRLKEVTFILVTNGEWVDEGLFEQWWKWTRDAMREASNSRPENIRSERGIEVVSKVEYGDCNSLETIGGS